MAIVQSVFVSNVCECVRVLESSRKLFCVTNVCALCLSPRQRGNRGRQCGGEGERSLPAHYRQSADAFRTVTQTGTTCLNPYRHTHKHTRVCVTLRTLCTVKMSHTHTFTATRSLYQQRCQVDYEVPYVEQKPTNAQSCLLFQGFDTKRVFIRDL